MEAQRERARASWVGEDEAIASIYRELASEIGEPGLRDMSHMSLNQLSERFLRMEGLSRLLEGGDEVELFLDKTPFYGESGGQVGDTGSIRSADGVQAEVVTTKKEVGLHAHVVRVKTGTIKVWTRSFVSLI